MESKLLTTGQVARLCGVTPDTVLKWVKKGKLPASRTPGGHYRIARQAIDSLGLAREEPAGDSADQLRDFKIRDHCWEFFGRHGVPRRSVRVPVHGGCGLRPCRPDLLRRRGSVREEVRLWRV